MPEILVGRNHKHFVANFFCLFGQGADHVIGLVIGHDHHRQVHGPHDAFHPGNAARDVLGLRLAVRKTGCSGFAYVVNYADEVHADDRVFEDRGVKVFVDPESLPLVEGTTVDFVKQGLNEAFRFSNHNTKGECGCGESFSV